MISPQQALQLVETAFDGVPPPGPGHKTLHQAEAADNMLLSSLPPREEDHLGRWQDLPESHIEACSWALAHLDAQGVVYYLPALMRLGLRCLDADTAPPHLVGSLPMLLDLGRTDDLRLHHRDLLRLLTRAQRVAIAAYMRLTRSDPASLAAWERVVEAEAAGPREDWFELWWPSRPRPSAAQVREVLDAAFPPSADPGPTLLEERQIAILHGAIPTPADLGAMLRAVNEGDEGTGDRRRDDVFCRLFDDLLYPDLRPDRRAAHQRRIASLSPEERRAIALFVERHAPRASTRAAWARLAEAEKNGPVEDWLGVLYAPPDP